MSVRCVVVMGVSGCGKTTVGRGLAEELGWPYQEGDDLHPAANIAKMAAGIPLDDADRQPWLEAVAAWIGQREQAGQSAVITCSALKRGYRDLLREGHESAWFAFLDVPVDVLRERLRARRGHYMPASLLDSQLATLEPLQPDEPGETLSGADDPTGVIAFLREELAPHA